MGGTDTEYCGRCSMTSVVDTTMEGKDEEERADRNPFVGERIQIEEESLRAVSPSAWLADVVRRIDDLATRLTYGK